MIRLRSVIFAAAFYLWSAGMCVICTPILLLPRSATREAQRFWAKGVLLLLRVCCDVKVELRGREHLPTGRGLIAAKHLCMLDVFAQFAFLPDVCFVMRKELMRIPYFGWYAAKARMIVVDREGGARALKQLVRDGQERLAEDRQLLIFPEGHRGEPGLAGDYQPGVAALYRELKLSASLVATNSGVHWPAHGLLRRPGTIVFEYLPPLPPGLPRAEFMRLMQERIEAASNALLPL